jgi:hypothetical protein
MDTSNKMLKYLETVEKDVKFIEEQIKNNPNNTSEYEEQLDSLLGNLGSKLLEISNEETTTD